MSKKERVKLEIDVLKALLLIFLTAIFGVSSFAVMNYQKINFWQGISILIGVFFLLTILYLVARRIITNLNKIEEME